MTQGSRAAVPAASANDNLSLRISSPPPSPPGSPPINLSKPPLVEASPATARVEQAMSELREILMAASTPRASANVPRGTQSSYVGRKPTQTVPIGHTLNGYAPQLSSSATSYRSSAVPGTFSRGRPQSARAASFNAAAPAEWEPLHVADWAAATFEWGEQYRPVFLGLRVTGSALLTYNLEVRPKAPMRAARCGRPIHTPFAPATSCTPILEPTADYSTSRV